MVNGVEMVFSKQKMIERVTKEGHANMLDKDTLAIMDNLDGQPVGTNSWKRQVDDAPVYACYGKDKQYMDVNENDCVYASEWIDYKTATKQENT